MNSGIRGQFLEPMTANHFLDNDFIRIINQTVMTTITKQIELYIKCL